MQHASTVHIASAMFNGKAVGLLVLENAWSPFWSQLSFGSCAAMATDDDTKGSKCPVLDYWSNLDAIVARVATHGIMVDVVKGKVTRQTCVDHGDIVKPVIEKMGGLTAQSVKQKICRIVIFSGVHHLSYFGSKVHELVWTFWPIWYQGSCVGPVPGASLFPEVLHLVLVHQIGIKFIEYRSYSCFGPSYLRCRHQKRGLEDSENDHGSLQNGKASPPTQKQAFAKVAD